MSYLEVPGAKLYYEVDGSGPAVLLMHAGVANLRQWQAQADAWRDRFQVIRFDTRGFGRTLTEDVAYSNREDMRLLLDHLGVDRAHVVGNSRGGSIAIDFTLEHPDRVASLVPVGSGLSGFDGPDDGIDWGAMDELWKSKDWDTLVEREVQIWTDGIGQPADRVEPSVRRQMTEWGLENYRAEQPAEKAIVLDPPAAGRLGEITVPTLVVWGDLDAASVLAASEFMTREIPGSRSHVFAGVAHMVNLERPAEFNALVGEFISDIG